MVLERSVLLLQQEEEEYGPDEGIHGDTTERKNTEKMRNKTEGTNGGNCFGQFFCHDSQEHSSTERGDTENSQIEFLIIHRECRRHKE